jgi:hypothetical protein
MDCARHLEILCRFVLQVGHRESERNGLRAVRSMSLKIPRQTRAVRISPLRCTPLAIAGREIAAQLVRAALSSQGVSRVTARLLGSRPRDDGVRITRGHVKEGQGTKLTRQAFLFHVYWKYSIAQRTFLRGIVSTLPTEQDITVISQVHIAASQRIHPPKLETTMCNWRRNPGPETTEINSRSA